MTRYANPHLLYQGYATVASSIDWAYVTMTHNPKLDPYKVMRSMTYRPRRARVPHPPNKFKHHLKIGYESCEAW